MSLAGKIFSVLALVLAIFYVGVTVTLVSLQENYRKQMVKQRDDLNAKIAEKEDAIKDLEYEKKELTQERERLVNKSGELQGEVNHLRKQWAESAALNRVQQNIIQDQEQEIKRLEDRTDTWMVNYNEERAKTERLKDQIAQIEQDKEQLTVARDQFQDRLVAAEKTRDGALQEVEKLTQDINRYVSILQRIKEQRPDVYAEAVRGETIQPKKAIRGKVTAVDKKLGLVVFDAGQRNDVRKGFSFIVFRDDQYVGKVVVDEVFPDVSAAHYIRDQMATDVEVGDDVTTKLVTDF
ncbi:MAG: hypothetical protein ACODAJ_01830 [Planctomycetota bacterium]